MFEQKINIQKSSIAFSYVVDEAVIYEISTISQIPVTTELGKYLGIPSLMGWVHSHMFQHILERIEGRLEGWKAKHLTLADRTTLAK